MRNVGFMAIALLFVFASGCNHKNKERRPIWWDGKYITAEVFQGKVMAAMIWIRPAVSKGQNFPADYQVYKRFDDDDYETFMECLRNPEKPSLVYGVAWNEFLYITFLDGTNYLIPFDICQKTIIVPIGYSERLYSLLSEKEINPAYKADKDWGLIIVPGLRVPITEHRYRDDWIDPNIIQKTRQ